MTQPLNTIKVQVKVERSQNSHGDKPQQGLSVLNEILDALEALADGGTNGLIDLRTLPLSAVDLSLIEQTLGTGEVEAKINVFGESQVQETGVAGVWRIRHFNEAGTLVADHIEICAVPSILASSPHDIACAIDLLQQKLRAATGRTG